jgi:hypothetical protein
MKNEVSDGKRIEVNKKIDTNTTKKKSDPYQIINCHKKPSNTK